MFPTSREGHRSAIERRNLGGHSISCGRPLRVLWHRRDLLWIPQPPAKYVRGEVLGSRVCCVGWKEREEETTPSGTNKTGVLYIKERRVVNNRLGSLERSSDFGSVEKICVTSSD
ncbi:hypothetical protein AVEN_12119-1 [Araneus ventricosus]|uniref:Uncharacterized protein n=1 Tax=Araneus ventricosus TaxID=182803 RepID=A0A4Y2M176_ARAVE|nr:hypothetical protein AVEN_12119-1 [Araneus ventricosus]